MFKAFPPSLGLKLNEDAVRSRNLIPVYGISGLLTSHLRSRLQLQSVQLRVALHRLVRSLGSKAATSGEEHG